MKETQKKTFTLKTLTKSSVWDIQENVKKEVQFMTGRELEAVNIHVQGVKADDKK